MKLGIVGKPNVGKTTLFNALTLGSEKTGNYPFTTIDGSEGVAYVKIRCVCSEMGVRDTPVNSVCREGWRFIPIKIVDTAGLVPDAWRGRGLGNQFLSKIMEADAWIHVIDLSGATDKEGNIGKPGEHDPLDDIKFIEHELRMWVRGILEKNYEAVERDVRHRKTELGEALHKVLSGLAVKREAIENIIEELGVKDVSSLRRELDIFVDKLLREAKPMAIAGNKIDMPHAKENLEKLRAMGIEVHPISAVSEYFLKNLDREGKIRYVPGDPSFEILKPGELTQRERKALTLIKEKILDEWGGTGVQNLVDHIVLELLGYIAVYPVKDINRLTDGEGRVLPDTYLVPRGTTLKELAYMIHSDLGDRIKYGYVYGKTTRVSPDYILRHRDIVSIQIY